ncbi:unnamed protein product [Rotaria magnacalcarata]|nr:unnamed protein product [Rotaria magnacalcarata]
MLHSLFEYWPITKQALEANDNYAERVHLDNLCHIPGHTPIFLGEVGGRTLYRFRCNEACGEPEQSFLHEVLPQFIVNVIVKHQVPVLNKIPFILHHQITSTKFNKKDRLSASDMMIVRKVIEYIYERYILNEQQQQQQQQQPQTQTQQQTLSTGLVGSGSSQQDGNGEQQRESDISKSIDHIELLCQEQILDLSMDLRTVKHFMWKGGGDLVLCFRTKS